MRTKRRPLGRKFQLSVLVCGIVVLLLAVAGFFRVDREQAEESLRKTANYMKVQCATYTLYNNGAETQALLRATESNRQVRKEIAEAAGDGKEVTEELLQECAEQVWLHGILILDVDGNTICSYAKEKEAETQLLENYSRGTVLNGADYQNRTYTQRIYLDDGAYINMAAAARMDAPGVVVTYYYITSDCARNYSLTLQSLLEGYQIATDGTILVADGGHVIASNDTSLIGTSTTDNAVVQTLKNHADSRHIVHIADNHSYGLMLKQRDYYIYAYIADRHIFATLPQMVLIVMLLYGCVASILWMLLKDSDERYLKLGQEKENQYRKELLASAKKAEAANVAKTEFLQRMSHDIRTPINGICGMLEVGEYYADDLEKQSECRSKIREASHLLLELVNEVLDMGKLESGEVVLDNQPFDLHEVLNEVITVIDKLATEQGLILIQEEFRVTHWHLIGSAGHVKRLLMNIMSNAVKYNKKHGMITIRCRELPAEKEGTALLEFICEDTGIGMSEEYQKKIFEPFTQESSETQSKYGGSGLGMPIAKGLVDKMGGTLTFESREKKGTTFVATIPFEICPEEVQEEKEKLSEETPTIQGLHILLAEDNELNMEIAEFLLTTEGAVVQKAWDGQEAVNLFARSEPGTYDAILMDMMMPVMDGCQAAREIRAMDREDAKTIPIIAMTANAFTDDRIRTREAGMDAHLSKPLDAALVMETLVRLAKK